MGSGGSRVLVDHAAKDPSSPYRCVDSDGHVRLGVGSVLVETLMWTVIVEVAPVGVQHGTGVALVADQHPVGALGSDASNEPLRETVRPRRLRWRPDVWVPKTPSTGL